MVLPPKKIQYEIETKTLANFLEGIEEHHNQLLKILQSDFRSEEVIITRETETEYNIVDRIQPPNCPQTDKTWLRAKQNHLSSTLFYAIDQHKGYGNRDSDERLFWQIDFKEDRIFYLSTNLSDPTPSQKNSTLVDLHFASYFDDEKIATIIQKISVVLKPYADFYKWNRFSKSREIAPPEPFHTSYILTASDRNQLFECLSSHAQEIFHSFFPNLDPNNTRKIEDEKTEVNIIDRISSDLAPATTIKSTIVTNGPYKLDIFQSEVDHKSLSHIASNSSTFWTILFKENTKIAEICQRYGQPWNEGFAIHFFEPFEKDKVDEVSEKIEQILGPSIHPYSQEIKKALQIYGGYSSFDYRLTASSCLEIFQRFSEQYGQLMNLILGSSAFKAIALTDYPTGGKDLLKKLRFMPYEVVLYYEHAQDRMEFLLLKNKALIFSISCRPGSEAYVKAQISSALHKGDDVVTLLYLIADDLGFKTGNSFNF